MPNFFRISVFAVCLLAAANGFAQVPAKNLNRFLKASFTAPKNFAALETLSKAQIQTLNNRFYAIEETRRALYQNPGWAVSAEFTPTARYLTALGMPLPKQPARNASLKEKELYRQQLNQLLQQESNTLSQIIQKNPRPKTSVAALNWDGEKMVKAQATSRQSWEKILNAQTPSISWGTPNWDEIRLTPVVFSGNPQDEFYISEEVLDKITEKAEASMTETYDCILQEKSLSLFQKQRLISLIDEASAVLTYNFVRLYMYMFGEIPSVSYDIGSTPKPVHSLEKYAASVQRRLLNKLQLEGQWSEEDFDLFADVSVYLPAEQARAVLAAATYLEPQAALWLLNNSLQDKASQRILNQIDWARTHTQTIWPNGNIAPKHKLGPSFAATQYERVKALKSHLEILNKRLNNLLEKKDQAIRLENMLQTRAQRADMPESEASDRLATQLFISSRQARLKRLINETQNNMQLIREELSNIWGE